LNLSLAAGKHKGRQHILEMSTILTNNDRKSCKLGIITAMHMFDYQKGLYIQLDFGRVIDRLAKRYEKVYLCAPVKKGKPNQSRDYRLKAENIEIVAQPFHLRTISSLKHCWGISSAYARLFRKSDVIFLRGMIPFVCMAYLWAVVFRKKACHWIVTNPIALLKSHRRAGRFLDALSILYAWQDRLFTKLGRALTGGSFICNGEELGKIYKSARTAVTISSTIRDDEIFEREDSCNSNTLRILFIGFVRPEKGLEYLLEAVSRVKIDKPWELTIVGSWNGFDYYHRKLERIIAGLQIGDRIRWTGYVPYGPEMFEYMRESDLFVLPTLSEGTPRVLVEARANSLPIIATRVGGIPTSVTNGKDGLLVVAKDPKMLAEAIERIVREGDLRRSLIKNGLEFAKGRTVNQFTKEVIEQLE